MSDTPPSRKSRESAAAPKPSAEEDTANVRRAKTRPAANLPEESASEDAPEIVLGEFRILRRLGRGGMAEVYLAEQTSLKRSVALKVLRAKMMEDPTYVKRFKTEALAAANLSHPNIVHVYTVGEADGVHFIAQEYVHGLNLRELLARKGPPDLPLVLHIMKQVAAALQAAGQAGIVHRDIKPENIMITRKGEVKVADFGLAKVTTAEGSAIHQTQVGVTMGTPLYMSPEQVNGAALDHRSDIYSFGVTCYHMLTGAPPFMGENAIAVALKHLREEPVPLQNARPDLPPALCQIIHKMMAKNADDRYASAALVLKDLKRLGQTGDVPLDEKPVESSPAKKAPRRTGPPPSGRFAPLLRFADRSFRWHAIALLLVALLVGSASAALGWVSRPKNPLSAPMPHVDVPHQETASDQYAYAVERPEDEAAWKAVIDYFPNDGFYTPRAMIDLGLMYLRDQRLNDAQRLFHRLSSYPDTDAPWRAAGLAGEAAVASLQDDVISSQEFLTQLIPLRQHLGTRMETLAKETATRNFKKSESKADEDIGKLFETPTKKRKPFEPK
jgi:serine/threonine-protein kinase